MTTNERLYCDGCGRELMPGQEHVDDPNGDGPYCTTCSIEALIRHDAPIECVDCGGPCDIEGVCLSCEADREYKRQIRDWHNDMGV